jgi:hypothetical protein
MLSQEQKDEEKTTITVNAMFCDHHGNNWKVIRLIPGGKLELFDKARCYFSTRYHREVKEWTRIR